MTPLIFLDTETTGLKIDIHEPWEVAWITAHHDHNAGTLRIMDTAERLVGLMLPDSLWDPEALKIGRFKERHVHSERPIFTAAAVMAELTAAVARVVDGTDQSIPHLVGAVPSFDTNMMSQHWFGWPGFGEGLWHYHLIDVEVLAAGRLGVPPPYTHSLLAKMLGVTIDPATRHTALGDTDVCVKMYAAAYNLEII